MYLIICKRLSLIKINSSKVAKICSVALLLDELAEYCNLDGERRVVESITSLFFDPSCIGHVESRINQQGLPCKAKYSWVADSEVVP